MSCSCPVLIHDQERVTIVQGSFALLSNLLRLLVLYEYGVRCENLKSFDIDMRSQYCYLGISITYRQPNKIKLLLSNGIPHPLLNSNSNSKNP